MAKTKDIFLNIAANPTMTLEDLVSVGLTSDNTVLLDRAQYAASEKVQDMFRDSEGNFDEQKFNEWYDIAEQSYNLLATDEANINLMNVTAYDADNIFVDPSKRRQVNKPYAVKLPNPDRLNTGVTRIGKTSERTLSQDEIAQTQRILLNPTEVANGATPVYGDSPNDSWFKNFWDTRVMASWDEDGTHIDPITGNEVNHKKGDLKLNENGTYYYENLDGRSVYGKRVLNKFNTLTTDGSAWNKYDFFDSDSIEQKSIGGSVAKNLALVGSMFIPYVGWGVAAASVAHQSAGLFATLGKMLAGADNPTLNAIEGWVKSTDRRNLKTEYAQQNMWCWENFIDLIGDTTAQLREQRAIFKFVPGLIKGDFKALDDKAMQAFQEKLAKEGFDNATKLSFKDLVKLAKQQNPENAGKQLGLLFSGARDIYSARAQKAARKFVEDYYKLGEPIAKAYMTAITVQDTFGEAIEAGASNNEATLLTLGYAAAEAALLSTDLGKWIMPELRTERLRYKTIAKKLLELPQETREMSKQVARLSGDAKKDWAKRLFNIGKDIFNAEYSTMAKTVGSVAAQGLGEGIEEVSEELLADFSKSCFNLVQQLQGDDIRMAAWENMGNRYAMSLVGGIMGGGINAAASDYKVNKDLLNMNSQQALQQLVYMTRNDEMNDFWKVIDKTTLASKDLSTQVNESGTGYKQGTKEDNQDLEAKRALRKQIAMIESIINSEGAKLNDGGLLSTLIKADPSLQDLDPVKEYRMRALSNSATAGRFLNIWNTVTTDIVKNHLAQNEIIAKYGDGSQEKYSEEDKRELKRLGNALKELQERKDAMLNGERTREFVRDALFEMSHAVSEVWDDWCTEVRYAETKTGKKYSDISEEEKRTLKEQYEQLKGSNQYAEKVHELAEIYEALAISSSQGIQDSMNYFDQLRQQGNEQVKRLEALTKARLGALVGKTILDDGVLAIQKILDDAYKADIIEFDDSVELQNIIRGIEDDANNKIYNIRRIVEDGVERERSKEELTDEEKGRIKNIINDSAVAGKLEIAKSVFNKINEVSDSFISLGFIHPETKNMLRNMLNTLADYSSGGQEAADFGMLPIEFRQNHPEIGEEENFDAFAQVLAEQTQVFSDKMSQIEELPSTPIIESLRKFQLSTTADQTVVDLIEYLIAREHTEKKDISAFQLDNVTLEQFKAARQFLEMYRSAIVGARFDNIDIDSIVGFNTTLNELSGGDETTKLVEIDAQTADLVLEDINKLLMRLDYAQGLHKLNTGNKYNVQNKTALNKQFILHNKIKTFVSILGDKWKDEEGSTELADLEAAIAEAEVLNASSGFGGNYENRNFTLDPNQKKKIEEESIKIQTALHKFLSKHIDGSQESIDKLADLLKYDNFKGLIRENSDFLDQNSVDIDDSAFIWWLCATAALDPHNFYNNYRQIIGQEIDGERPIAPIPTQELGVFALTASVVNGDMFRTFGRALRQSLSKIWESDKDTRERIRQESGTTWLTDDKEDYFKNIDFLPNFDNILFIEGIAGSGKSTGVLKSWSRLMEKANPEFITKKILFAHTDKTKADTLAKSTSFTNYETHDHDSLLKYMSADYTPKEAVDGVIKFELGKDIKLHTDGILRADWKVKEYNDNDVPKVIVIDEWSHYNQAEQELIQRFSQRYGVTVIAMGDYDQLTPAARVVEKRGDQENNVLEITPSRNMTARIAKLGVSMRTDNEIKNQNMYRMLAWKNNPTPSIDLHYYEDETGIYGDKNYSVASVADILDQLKLDVQKMISTLKEGEKIGYIYRNTTSPFYQWLTTQAGIKEHIQPYSEKDAHGREAQYYIIENDGRDSRGESQSTADYFSSMYTGITRSEQGSLVVTSTDQIGKPNDAHKLSFKTKVEEEMIPNTFTDEGTRAFARNRKEVFDSIYGDTEATPFVIKERTREIVAMNPVSEVDEDSTFTPTPEPQQSTPETPPQVEPEPSSEPDPEPIPDSREGVSDNETWVGPLSKNQLLYGKNGHAKYVIVGEDIANNTYKLRNLTTGEFVEENKDKVADASFLKLPEQEQKFNIGDRFHDATHGYVSISKVLLAGDKTNPEWQYVLTNRPDKNVLLQSELIHEINNKTLIPSGTESDELVVKDTPYEVEGVKAFEEMVDEQVERRSSEQQPEAVTVQGSTFDFKFLGFTFNNQYLADSFNDNDELVLTDRDKQRIDSGYGLHKMNSVLFKTKHQIKDALGKIRKHLEFSSNQDILQTIQNLTRQRGLSIRWGFVSKYSNNADGKYGRFNHAQAALEYMGKEDEDVPNKTLSAIIYQNEKAVLELPIITLQSPHSIFRELKNNGVASDITSLWDFKKKAKGETFKQLSKILNQIETNHPNDPVYQKLGNIVKLWLFSSNGFKVLPANWNLSESATNLGNFYITQRVSDNIEEHNFHGQWVDLSTIERKDRFISSIVMTNENTSKYVDKTTNKECSVFRPYVPFVLISDDPTINDDTKAAQVFLAQQLDDTLPKRVKAYPVSPPEADVREYIMSMHRILTVESKVEPFSRTNSFIAYRIWEAILESPDANSIMEALKDDTKLFIKNTVAEVQKIKNNTVMGANETKLAYNRRLAIAQKTVLDKFDDQRIQAHARLRKALVDACMSPVFGTDVIDPSEKLQQIKQACDRKGITGILCKAQFEKQQAGKAIGDFAYKVRVNGDSEQDRYKFPGFGSFRIFGKIDSPTYDLDSLAPHIQQWAQDATKKGSFYSKKQEREIEYSNLWEFKNDDAVDFYLDNDAPIRFNKNNILQWRTKLLKNLGIPEYNINIAELDSCVSEAEAYNKVQQEINQKYLELPGAFIITTQSGFKYGNIITDRTPEFKNYKFKGITTTQSGYTITFTDLSTNTTQEVEVEVDLSTDSFKLIPNSTEEASTTVDVAQRKQELIKEFNTGLIPTDPVLSKLATEILNHYHEDTQMIDVDAIEDLLNNANLDGIMLSLFKATLNLDEVIQNSQDMCISPIKIKFK